MLIMSGGSLVGQNVLDALADRRAGVKLAATNSVATDISLFDFDAVHLVPPTLADPSAFEARFLDILAEEDPHLVVPCRDDDVVFLAGLRERRPELAGRLLCGGSDAARATCDKVASWRFARDHGLPFAPSLATPATDEEAEDFAREHGFPLLAKPRRGYASRGVFLVVDEAQLRRAARLEEYVMQRYLGDADVLWQYLRQVRESGVPLFHSFEGIKTSIQVFIAPEGAAAGYFCSRNVNRHGTSLRLERYDGSDAAELGEACLKAFARAQWRGPMNIQCQQTPDGRLVIYEFNGRFSGATAARCHMGYDEVALAVRTFAKRELGAARAAADAVVRRAVDRTLPLAARDALMRDGRWQRGAGREI